MKQFIKDLFAASFLVTFVASVGFVALEPAISSAVEDQFTITQTITSEISFLTGGTDITMNGSIAGITGGTSTGGTQVVVYTNDTSGYTMTIKASSSPAMQGISAAGSIADYTPAAPGIPDYTFSVPTGDEFAYTISASTTADLAQKFKDNGSNTCNTGSADTTGFTTCWYGLSTTATSTIVRSTQTAASGSTSTIYFQLKVNPNSSLAEDTYRATTTLTAVTN
jgi:hypothetical protein